MIKFTRRDVETKDSLEVLLRRIVTGLDRLQKDSENSVVSTRAALMQQIQNLSNKQSSLTTAVQSSIQGVQAQINQLAPADVQVYDETNNIWVSSPSVSTSSGGIVPAAPGSGVYWLNGLTGSWVRLGYGSCYGNEIGWSQASAAQNTWYEVSDSDIADGQLSAVTHDGDGKLTVTDSGIYLINWGMTAGCSVANKHLLLGIGITPNAGALSAANDGQQHLETLAVNSDSPVSGTTIQSLSALDAVDCIISTTDAGTPDLTVSHLNLTLVRIA